MNESSGLLWIKYIYVISFYMLGKLHQLSSLENIAGGEMPKQNPVGTEQNSCKKRRD